MRRQQETQEADSEKRKAKEIRMEKFMEIHKGCTLYEDYFKWLEDREKLLDIFDEIKKKYGFEADSFYPSKYDFRVKPTRNDLEKFKEMFKKTDYGCFKKNTDISKEWRTAVSRLEHIERPRMFNYFRLLGYRWKEKILHVEEKLYISIESDGDIEVPEFATEMKASEFYRIIEAQEDT